MSSAARTTAEIIGYELRAARECHGWTISDLLFRLHFQVGSTALSAYERGVRKVPLDRLLELCVVLDISAPRLIARICDNRDDTGSDVGITINLALLAATDNPQLLPATRWARATVQHNRGRRWVTLSADAVRVLAGLCCIPAVTLAEYLRGSAEPVAYR